MANLINPQHMKNVLWLIPCLPLIGAVINGLLGRRLPDRLVHFIGCFSVFIAFLVSVAGFVTLVRIEEPDNRLLIQPLYQWILTAWNQGSFSLEVAFRLDPLSAVLCLVVTGVGFLIHLYSVGYMAGDQSQGRYFAYLNLFTFSMLLLVLADNLLLMFVGWEGVGLCSYLLIGFWFSDLEKAQAGMKAFIVNRVGDFGFFVGLMLLFWTLFEGSGASMTGLGFDQLREAIPLLSTATPILGVGVATWVALLFFVGATGKSAQIPLYIWLPDAMAGPTPVSAFIHAATMVTAGVYMIVRLNFLYVIAPAAMAVVAVVGAVTAFYAATIALTQDDIKRVLAYSTISQLGYMFLAVGVAAFSSGIFHLVTHAFFKALLFLGAGSVIHAVHSNDMQEMGGLKKYMPHTYLTFMVAYLAISGIPPLSGFMSKDEILWSTFNSHLPVPGLGKALWALGLLGAGLTAFYMTRLIALTFMGSFRGGSEKETHLHESPSVMTVPLMILAVLSVVGGVIGLPAVSHLPNLLHNFLGPVLSSHGGSGHGSHAYALEVLLMLVSTGVAITGIYVGWLFYVKRPELPGRLAARFAGLYRLLLHKYYVDEIYQKLLLRPVLQLVTLSGRFDLNTIDGAVNLSSRVTAKFAFLVGWEDLKIVDGAVNGLADIFKRWGAWLRHLQTGRVQQYLYSVVLGIFCLCVFMLLF
ncbi:MAG: NADH-quinone oxidoreductase subunit L [Syntrophobacterales bacterium]|jgi:NADH-quinone oxidoreductase subunit L